MKLRNKKTGEIKEVQPITIGGFRYLAELNDEWEDYNELHYWYIDNNGYTLFSDLDDDKLWKDLAEKKKQIGNYFETKEEAEEAVLKLKAWKRLKDKGFRFTGHFLGTDGLNIHYECDMKNNIGDDLDLLFGDEE